MKSALTEKWIVCRICLRQPNEIMQTIFNNDQQCDMTQMISECGGVPIRQFDHYPDKICSRCLKYLRVAHKFRTTCQRSYKHLSRFIAPVDVEKGTMEEQASESELQLEPVAESPHEGDVELEFEEDDGIRGVALKMDPDISVKEEYSDVEGEVMDVYTPMDDEFEQFEEFESLDRDGSHGSDVVEYLEELGDELSTSDEEYAPVRKVAVVKKRPRGRPTKQEVVTKRLPPKATTSRDAAVQRIRIQKAKRGAKSKDDKEKTYICDVCGNIYPTQGRLTEHIKLHKGIKPYECEICGHAFAQNQQLARHMNTHTGNRPFKCSYCPAAFADLSTRNKHHRIHTNERPYVCDVCGKSFTYTNTLKFHKMIHTGEKPYVCDICGKGFQQAYKLRNHKQTHEKKGVKLEKIEVETLEAYHEVHDAAAQILEI